MVPKGAFWFFVCVVVVSGTFCEARRRSVSKNVCGKKGESPISLRIGNKPCFCKPGMLPAPKGCQCNTDLGWTEGKSGCEFSCLKDEHCGDHRADVGACISGKCKCAKGWGGVSCQVPRTAFAAIDASEGKCNGNGLWVAEGSCVCFSGFYGVHCDQFSCSADKDCNVALSGTSSCKKQKNKDGVCDCPEGFERRKDCGWKTNDDLWVAESFFVREDDTVVYTAGIENGDFSWSDKDSTFLSTSGVSEVRSLEVQLSLKSKTKKPKSLSVEIRKEDSELEKEKVSGKDELESSKKTLTLEDESGLSNKKDVLEELQIQDPNLSELDSIEDSGEKITKKEIVLDSVKIEKENEVSTEKDADAISFEEAGKLTLENRSKLMNDAIRLALCRHLKDKDMGLHSSPKSVLSSCTGYDKYPCAVVKPVALDHEESVAAKMREFRIRDGFAETNFDGRDALREAVCGGELKNLGSPAKGGSLFFLVNSEDEKLRGQFMIKTVHESLKKGYEKYNLLAMLGTLNDRFLPQNEDQSEHSFIARPYGFYEVEMVGTWPDKEGSFPVDMLYMLVIKNLGVHGGEAAGGNAIEFTYRADSKADFDLKGSNRAGPKKEQDFNSKYSHVYFPTNLYCTLIEALRQDIYLLKHQRAVDHSLFMVLHAVDDERVTNINKWIDLTTATKLKVGVDFVPVVVALVDEKSKAVVHRPYYASFGLIDYLQDITFGNPKSINAVWNSLTQTWRRFHNGEDGSVRYISYYAGRLFHYATQRVLAPMTMNKMVDKNNDRRVFNPRLLPGIKAYSYGYKRMAKLKELKPYCQVLQWAAEWYSISPSTYQPMMDLESKIHIFFKDVGGPYPDWKDAIFP